MGAVDALAIEAQKIANGQQALGALLGYAAQVVRPDVEQVVAPAADHAHQVAQQLLRGLPVGIKAAVAPGVVDGGGHLKGPIVGQQRDEVVAGGHVVAQAVANAAADQARWLMLLHQVAQAPGLFRRHAHGRVKPDEPQVTILG